MAKSRTDLHAECSLEKGADAETESMEGGIASLEVLSCALEIVGEYLVEAASGGDEVVVRLFVRDGHDGRREKKKDVVSAVYESSKVASGLCLLASRCLVGIG